MYLCSVKTFEIISVGIATGCDPRGKTFKDFTLQKTLPAVLSGTDMSLIIVICDVYSCRSAFMHDLVSCHTKCCLNMQHNQISLHAKTMSQDIPAVTFHPEAYTFLYACFFLALVYYYLSRQPLNCRSHSA